MFRRKGLARPQSPFTVFPECQLHCSQYSNLRFVKLLENARLQVTSGTTDPQAEKPIPLTEIKKQFYTQHDSKKHSILVTTTHKGSSRLCSLVAEVDQPGTCDDI